MKYIPLVLVLATPVALADTINMACPPGDNVVIHTVTNDGDFNGDGVVDLSDYSILRANYGQPTTPENETSNLTDLNGDGLTNSTDYGLFRMLLSQN